MNTYKRDGPDSLLLIIIAETTGQASPRTRIAEAVPEQSQLANEIRQLAVDQEFLHKALSALFPSGVPSDLTFYSRLIELNERLGWGEMSRQAVGLVWAAAIHTLAPTAGEKVLALFPKVADPGFFMRLGGLRDLFQKVPLPAEFAVGWLQAIARHVGNDFAGGAFWDSLGAYCETQVDAALNVLELSANVDDEAASSIAAYILGALRAEPLSGHAQGRLMRLDSGLAGSCTPHGQMVYFRSWVQTTSRGKASREDLEALATRVATASPQARETAFWVFSRFPLIPNLRPELFAFALDWLARNASPNISSPAKYHTVELVALLAATDRHDSGSLILSVQPIPPEEKGSWTQIEQYLVSRLKKDADAFISFCISLAERNAHGWLQVMREPQGFEWLLQELRGKDVGELVGHLALSRDAGSRKLALFFFDDLDLESLPNSVLDKAGHGELRLAFHEAQRSLANGKAIARYLIALLPCVQNDSTELQDEMFDELVLQAKNYGGECREEFEKRAGGLPLLRKALDVAKQYFDALGRVQNSAIGQMDVPGYRQALRLSGRRFSNEISKGTAAASDFMKLFKHVSLLYGKQWRSFQGGALSQTSGLKTISSSFEVPRLEIIDPEGMALHRLQVSTTIVRIAPGGELEIKG